MFKNGLIQCAPSLAVVAIPIIIFAFAMMKVQATIASFTFFP